MLVKRRDEFGTYTIVPVVRLEEARMKLDPGVIQGAKLLTEALGVISATSEVRVRLEAALADLLLGPETSA